MPSSIIRFETDEYFHTPKNRDWYWSIGIIVATVAVISLWLANYIFALFILVAGIAFIIHASKEPRKVNCEINDSGIVFGNTLYPYSSIESFCIDISHEKSKLIIKSTRLFVPYVSIPLSASDPEDIRTILLQKIPETEHPEELSYKLLELVGF